jgi:predicted ribosomally synthesized peptide with SipW-like signal peptide
MKKTLITILATVLVCCFAVGGTLAWLTAKSETVTNTFTVGDIDIDLTESKDLDLKIVPGTTITKDPKVTVKGGSEACWLFIKIEKENWNDALTYTLDGWTALSGVADVYYRSVDYKAGDQTFAVIKDNTIEIANTLTKSDLEAMAAAQPKLTFTAYAVQSEGVNDVAVAWGYANP